MKGIIEQIADLIEYDDLAEDQKLEAIKDIIKDVKEAEKKENHDIIVILDHNYQLGYVLPSRKPKSDEEPEELYENILRENGRKPSECSWMVVKGSEFCIHNRSNYEIEIYEEETENEE